MEYLNDIEFLLAVAGILFLGGWIKGVIGLGLPLVSVPLLTYLLPVPVAIFVLAVPVLVSNCYQATRGGLLVEALQRFWPLLTAMMLGVALGAQLLITLDERSLYLILGTMVTLLGFIYLFGGNLMISARFERGTGVAVGFGSGLLGGVSSFLGPPIVLYLVALHLGKELFIVALALVFFLGGVPLYGTLAASDIVGWDEILLSALGVLPVMLGVFAGQRLRRVMPQELFRRVVLAVMVIMGLLLIRRGLVL